MPHYDLPSDHGTPAGAITTSDMPHPATDAALGTSSHPAESMSDLERKECVEDAIDELLRETRTAVLSHEGTLHGAELLRRAGWLETRGAMDRDERQSMRERVRIESRLRARIVEALEAYTDHDWARHRIADVLMPVLLSENLR